MLWVLAERSSLLRWVLVGMFLQKNFLFSLVIWFSPLTRITHTLHHTSPFAFNHKHSHNTYPIIKCHFILGFNAQNDNFFAQNAILLSTNRVYFFLLYRIFAPYLLFFNYSIQRDDHDEPAIPLLCHSPSKKSVASHGIVSQRQRLCYGHHLPTLTSSSPSISSFGTGISQLPLKLGILVCLLPY